MGLFNLFSSSKEITFKPFLDKGFITEQELQKLNSFKEGGRPVSVILDDQTPENLFRYIWTKTNQDYNHKYFKKTNWEYAFRKPFWIEEDMDDATRKKVHSDQKSLLKCFSSSNLLSPLTIEKINRAVEEGIIYKIWEIISIAKQLSKNEEEFSKAGVPIEKINQKSDIINQYPDKVIIPGKIETRDATSDISYYLGKALELLPFHRHHEIKDVSFVDDLDDPYHKQRKPMHTKVAFEFNGKEYFSSINTDNAYYKVAPGFDISIIAKSLNQVCAGTEYVMMILKNYRFDIKSAENGNIESYTLLPRKKNSTNSVLFEHKLSSSFDPGITLDDKKKYLEQLYQTLDHLPEKDIAGINKNVLEASYHSLDQVPNFVPNFIFILWYDNLSEGYTYKDILIDLSRISKGRFKPMNIIEDDSILLKFQVNGKDYSTELKNGTVDYDIFRIIETIQNENDLGGKFWCFNEPYIDQGYPIIFLSHAEKERLDANHLFKVSELNTVVNVWLDK